MPKRTKITANADNSKWERQHSRNIAYYQRQIDEIFKKAAEEAASIAEGISHINPDNLFSFSRYPSTKKRVEKLMRELRDEIRVVIVNGIDAEWKLANDKNDTLCQQVFGDKVEEALSTSLHRRYFSSNRSALEAFHARKIAGLNLSDRVWKYTGQFQQEIEMGIDIGIREGMAASRLSRQLRQYLRYPDKLFRRVRDEHGDLQLSKRAMAFHPGQGVYRSSYKNALRLAATETNIAYRSADHERWKNLDFVVGIHIIMSNNHTTTNSKGRRVPLYDICDELSGVDEDDEKGRYPKDFKFVGWHPNCRCHAISILKTAEEMAEDNRRIMDGEKPMDYRESENVVEDVPEQFREWVEQNAERIENAKSLPYFISDNETIVDGILS